MLLHSVVSLLGLASVVFGQGGACGSQAKGALCPDKQCCGQYGYCGTTAEYCLTSKRCQSQCINDGPPPPPAGPKAPSIDTSKLFKPPAGTFDNLKLVGYFSNWAQYRGLDPSTPACHNDSVFLPENINPYLYTHINYAFVFMAENFTIIPHEYDDEDLSLRMNRWIKKLNPSCTTSYSVGGCGWLRASQYTGGIDYTPFFSRMASTAANRKVFINSAIAWARKLEFDGIDIDWEFVGNPERGGSSADRANFNSLVQELRAAAKTEAASSGKKELILTMAAPAGPDDIARIDPKTIAGSIDWFNLMTYDFYGNWDAVVENQAPIVDQRLSNWSFTSAINIYLGLGVPSRQLVAGLPLYGRVWTLTDLTQTTPGSPGAAGIAGRCTAQKGYLSYFEIQEILNSQNGRGVNFVPGNGYYLTFDDQWVGYDDEFSFVAKMDIIFKKNLGGAMLWAVDQDTKDFNLTKTLLTTFRACPSDGDWPATLAGQGAEIDCPTAPGFTQTRNCGNDGKWGVASNMDCIVNGASQAQFLVAKDVCIQGQ
ncbi:chitinase [Ceratobasidium sp. AG-Ba]|nr:chitinase [Ceratobasidium sp. AG-Ba]